MTIHLLIKNLVCRVGFGDRLIEYCNECGIRQPLDWWCPDPELWKALNGAENGVLCPECFSARADRDGHFLRWYPVDEKVIPVAEPRHDAPDAFRQRHDGPCVAVLSGGSTDLSSGNPMSVQEPASALQFTGASTQAQDPHER